MDSSNLFSNFFNIRQSVVGTTRGLPLERWKRKLVREPLNEDNVLSFSGISLLLLNHTQKRFILQVDKSQFFFFGRFAFARKCFNIRKSEPDTIFSSPHRNRMGYPDNYKIMEQVHSWSWD